MSNVLKRIEILEKEIGGTCPAPAGERLFVSYGDDNLERLTAEKLEKLRSEYGPSVMESDLILLRVIYDGGPSNVSKDGLL